MHYSTLRLSLQLNLRAAARSKTLASGRGPSSGRRARGFRVASRADRSSLHSLPPCALCRFEVLLPHCSPAPRACASSDPQRAATATRLDSTRTLSHASRVTRSCVIAAAHGADDRWWSCTDCSCSLSVQSARRRQWSLPRNSLHGSHRHRQRVASSCSVQTACSIADS